MAVDSSRRRAARVDQWHWLLLALLVLAGGLLAHAGSGLTGAVALGAKPGVLFWMLSGLVADLNGLKDRKMEPEPPADTASQAHILGVDQAMIQCISVGYGAAWPLGLALTLGTASLANPLACHADRRLWDVLSEGGFQVAINLPGSLVCGVVGQRGRDLGTGVVGVLAMCSMGQTWLPGWRRRTDDNEQRQS